MTEAVQPPPSGLEVGSSPSGAFTIDPGLVATGRTCVIGSSGSGKSYAVGVLCEELCRVDVPFAIVDPEGEHSGLKQKYEAIWLGDSTECDLLWEGVDLADLAKQAPDISPLILDVSGVEDPKGKVSTFVEFLFKTLTERRTPYLLIVEEADKFVPQNGQRVQVLAEVARRGRKRGLGLMVCSQRPSLVDKNVLSQCGNQLVGKLVIQNDLESVAQFFPGRGLPKELTSLSAGEFYALGGFSSVPMRVKVRKRFTKPGGVTPELAKRVVKKYLGPGQVVGGGQASSPIKEDKGVGASAGGSLGLQPSIGPDGVPALVRRERKHGLFGPKETVTAVEPRYLPMVQLGVAMRRGLLKRRFETAYLLLDGSTGKVVTIGKGLETSRGFEKLLGLTHLQVDVLKEVSPDSDTSAIEVSSRIGESKSSVSRVLSALNEKRLVRVVEIGRKKVYRRLVDLPEEPTVLSPMELSAIGAQGARVSQPKVSERDLREAVKALWKGADVASFEAFLYPVYSVELLLGRKRRRVVIDGRSGKELVT